MLDDFLAKGGKTNSVFDDFLARGGKKEALKQEKKTIAFAFPSVVALEDLAPGMKLTYKNIFLKRPKGLGPTGPRFAPV